MDVSWKPGRKLSEVVDATVLTALAHFQGNRLQTARDLGICLRTLRVRLANLAQKGHKILPPAKPSQWKWTEATHGPRKKPLRYD